jgi:condensin complex subunit 2
MPSSRRARAPSSSQPLYAESDSGGDTDKEDYTPKPARHGIKKRLSEVYNDADASFSSDRAPLRSVNINDDAAEKRRRRRSTKITAVLDPEDGGEQEPGRAAQGKAKLLTSAAPPPVINVPLDVMSSNFEEWMKMATDNVRVYTMILPIY